MDIFGTNSLTSATILTNLDLNGETDTNFRMRIYDDNTERFRYLLYWMLPK